MNNTFSYIILGAGKQGLAAGYDVIRFGQASRLVLADSRAALARQGAERLKRLAGPILRKKKIVLKAVAVNARRISHLKQTLKGHDAALSALPYYLNPIAARAALEARAHYCDLGGYFETTQTILKLHARAKRAGVTLIPDCGVSPGMCNSLAVCGMEQLDRTESVRMYCGGLPQRPRPPLDYKVVFNLEGLLGNYFGKAYVLRNGKVARMPSFSEREQVHFGNGLGTLEAVVTGGATSTCPWTFRGRVKTYEYKTLRYPGHYDKIQLLKDLGLLETTPVMVNGQKVIPRLLFVSAAGPRLSFPDDRDLLVQRVVVRGKRGGRAVTITYDVRDAYDPKTGFTAMQRTTGFSAAIVLEMLAQGRIPWKGAVPLEKAVPGRLFLDEIRRRGIAVKETVTPGRPHA
jgi:lysine 6-dehydrogenase